MIWLICIFLCVRNVDEVLRNINVHDKYLHFFLIVFVVVVYMYFKNGYVLLIERMPHNIRFSEPKIQCVQLNLLMRVIRLKPIRICTTFVYNTHRINDWYDGNVAEYWIYKLQLYTYNNNPISNNICVSVICLDMFMLVCIKCWRICV